MLLSLCWRKNYKRYRLEVYITFLWLLAFNHYSPQLSACPRKLVFWVGEHYAPNTSQMLQQKLPVSDFKTMLSFLSSKTRPPWCCEKYEKNITWRQKSDSQNTGWESSHISIQNSDWFLTSHTDKHKRRNFCFSLFQSQYNLNMLCWRRGKPPVLPLLSLFLPTPEASFPLLLLSVPRHHPAEMEGPSLLLFFGNLFNSKIPLQLPMTHRLCFLSAGVTQLILCWMVMEMFFPKCSFFSNSCLPSSDTHQSHLCNISSQKAATLLSYLICWTA